jgi:hypothetical protein
MYESARGHDYNVLMPRKKTSNKTLKSRTNEEEGVLQGEQVALVELQESANA